MNGKIKPHDPSRVLPAIIKKFSVPRPTPEPGKKIYNPALARERDRTAAKIWELLRRNPRFIHRAEVMIRLSKRESKIRSGLNCVNKAFRDDDITSGLGSFVLRWLFRPQSWDFNFLHEPRVEHDWLRIEHLFSKSEYKKLEKLIAAEKSGRSFPGPLTVRKGPFSLMTPWPETPELFRFLFIWLASVVELWEHDLGPLFKPKILSLQDHNNFPHEINPKQQIGWFIERYDIFAVPRVVLSVSQRRGIEKQFKNYLLQLKKDGRIVSTKEFLGTETDWNIFLKCHSEIGTSSNPKLRTQVFKSYSIAIPIKKMTSTKTEWRSHIKSSYGKMEFCMHEMWPGFGVLPLVLLHLIPVPTSNGIASIKRELIARSKHLSDDGISGPYSHFNNVVMGRMARKLRGIASTPVSP